MAVIDEQAFAEALPPAVRNARGAFFTPAEIVEQVLALAGPVVAEFGRAPAQVIDPACGAGAFLSAAAKRWPTARLLGVDLEAASLAQCAQRVPTATLREANALTSDALNEVTCGVTVWLGNPPYNGTSALLQTPDAWNAARRWLPDEVTLPKGTSLRDDFIFFLLRASKALEGADGVLAFVTSATLLDAFQHTPIRDVLLRRLSLRHVVDLGAGAFRGTRVRTCITVWSTRKTDAPHTFNGEPVPSPRGPEFSLRPTRADAEALDAEWRAEGIPLTTLVPISFSGLKTRFDELLVDNDPARLLERLTELSRTDALEAFSLRHALPPSSMPKLRVVKAAMTSNIDSAFVRPFHRYRGPQPMGPAAFCYLDKALIPRGDHRFRGSYDPHAEPVKLVFNTNELPLAAKVIDAPGCVTAYRHSRFAPLFVPERLMRGGLGVTRSKQTQALGQAVPNLAVTSVSPRKVFERIANFINSHDVQDCWAPAFGTRRVLPVPLRVVEGR